MKKEQIEKLITSNPKVDRERFLKAQEKIQRLRKLGVKSKSASASPPESPYGNQIQPSKRYRQLD